MSGQTQVADAVVVGAGIGGLVAAHTLATRGLRVVVLEAADRAGGPIRGGSFASLPDVPLDLGAESFAVRGGVVERLAEELGLTIESPAGLSAWGYAAGRAFPLPAAGVLGIPSRPWAADVRRAIGWPGVLRGALDRVLPARIVDTTDLGTFARSRLGSRVADRLVTPVAAGVHSAPLDRLDVAAVAPGLLDAYARTGSLSRAVASLRAAAPPGSAVRGIDGGVHALVDALVERLDVRVGTRVVGVERLRAEVVGTENAVAGAGAAGGETKTIDGGAKAADSEAKAADSEAKAADSEAKAAGGEARAAGGGAKAAGGGAEAAGGGAEAAGGGAKAAGGEDGAAGLGGAHGDWLVRTEDGQVFRTRRVVLATRTEFGPLLGANADVGRLHRDRSSAGPISMQPTDLTTADLQGTDLTTADVQTTDLASADVQRTGLAPTASPALVPPAAPERGADIRLVTLLLEAPELDAAPRGSGMLVAPGPTRGNARTTTSSGPHTTTSGDHDGDAPGDPRTTTLGDYRADPSRDPHTTSPNDRRVKAPDDHDRDTTSSDDSRAPDDPDRGTTSPSNVRAKALTHATAKWPWLARRVRDAVGPGWHVVRLSYGRIGEPTPDPTAEEAARDASVLLGVDLTGRVRDSLHQRWDGSLPPPTPAYRAAIKQFEEAVRAEPGLDVTGGWIAGTGLAAIVGHAQRTAERLEEPA